LTQGSEKSIIKHINKMNPIETALRQLVFSWEEASASEETLTSLPPLSESAKAFAAALLIAREGLLGYAEATMPTLFLPPPPEENWLKTQWAPDFELGRWTVLLWVVCQVQDEMPNTFWDEQKEIFAQLYAVFSGRQKTDDEAKQVLSQLNDIEQYLAQLPSEKKEIYAGLVATLANMMALLAPKMSH
jgi:hypothetical protein